MSDPKKEAEEYGMLQFSDSEISIIMQINIDELRRDYADDINRGRLKAEAEVRKSILDAAKTGNTSAQKQFMILNRVAKRNEG